MFVESEEWKLVIVITVDALQTLHYLNQHSEGQNDCSELKAMRQNLWNSYVDKLFMVNREARLLNPLFSLSYDNFIYTKN